MSLFKIYDEALLIVLYRNMLILRCGPVSGQMEVVEGMAILETGGAEEESGRKEEVSRRDSPYTLSSMTCDVTYIDHSIRSSPHRLMS